MDRYCFRSVVDMYRWFVNKIRHSIGIDLYKIKTRKITDNVTATGFTKFSEVGLGLIEGANIVLTLRNPHIVRRPKTKGIDRRSSPSSAIVTVATSHHRRYTDNFKLNRTTETTTLVGIAHHRLHRFIGQSS